MQNSYTFALHRYVKSDVFWSTSLMYISKRVPSFPPDKILWSSVLLKTWKQASSKQNNLQKLTYHVHSGHLFYPSPLLNTCSPITILQGLTEQSWSSRGTVHMSVPWRRAPAVVLNWATMRADAVAQCNGSKDCMHAISSGNLHTTPNTC